MQSVELYSVVCGGDGPVLPGTTDNPEGRRPFPVTLLDNRSNLKTPCQWYQDVLIGSTADIICMIHDDVEIYDPTWHARVMHLFESNPDCAAVGLGGAPQLGHESLYKKRYCINQLARQGYVSNQTDYDIHGGLLEGDLQVAVIEQFFMAVRRDFLLNTPVPPKGDGDYTWGWPTAHLTHHGLDMWLACEAAHQGKQIWATGVKCLHKGGGTSTKPAYVNAKWLQGSSLTGDHQLPHKWLYESYGDVLPVKVRR